MSQILYSLISIVLLYFLIVAICYFYLKAIKKDILLSWSSLLSLLNSRLDKIPVIIQIYKEYDNNSKYLEDIVAMRSNALNISSPDIRRFEDEQLVSKLIKPIISSIDSNKSLNSNIVLQMYSKEYSSSQKALEIALEKYNKKILDYNKLVKLPLFKFFFSLLGLKEDVTFSI